MFRRRFFKGIVLCILSLILCIGLNGCGRNSKKGTEGLEYEAVSGSYIVTGYHGSEVHVVIPDTYNDVPVTEIGEYAFECSEIQSVTIGKNVTYIGPGAFASSTLLKEVYIPASVEEISGGDYGGFAYCISLEKVTIEKGSVLSRIGHKAFEECESLKEINLPDGLKRIEEDAFSYCVSLERLTIPATVEYIGKTAFYEFTEAQEIIIEGTTEGWQQEVELQYDVNGKIVSVYPERAWDFECNAKITKGNKSPSVNSSGKKEEKPKDKKISLFGKKGVYLISKKTTASEDSRQIEEYTYSNAGEWVSTECNFEGAAYTHDFEYNNDGYVIKRTYYSDDSKETVASYTEIIRNDDNQIVKFDIQYCYDENEYGIYRMVQNYSYNEDGSLEKYTLEAGYCKDGQWAQEMHWSDEVQFEYEYKDKKLITVYEIPADSSQTQYRYEYEYDDATGLLKSRVRYSIEDGVENVVGYKKLSYDENGNVLTIMNSDFEFSADNSTEEYEYTYFDVKPTEGMFGTSEEVINELMFLSCKF